MKYPYTCTRGTITYVTSDGYECGREWFSLHRHDRGRFVRAVCEMEEEGLLAFPIDIGVTYLGEERLTVAAGEFDAHKFHVRWRPEWTPAAIWVWGEDYIFLKSMWEVSGLTCELTSLEVVPPIT